MKDPYAPQQRMTVIRTDRPIMQTLVFGFFFILLIWWVAGPYLAGLVYPDDPADETPLNALAFLASTCILWIAVALALRYFQGRRWMEFILPLRVAIRDFRLVVYWVGALMLFVVLFFQNPSSVEGVTVKPLGQWVVLVPFIAIACFIQTSGEEMFFRGFLQSTIAAMHKSPLIWAVLPSIAFGFIHFGNGSTLPENIQIVIYTGVFGLAAADLTARTGTLGAAMGFHFVHNLTIFTLTGSEGAPAWSLALWLIPAPDYSGIPAGALPVILVIQTLFNLFTLWLFWLAARIAIRA